MGDKVLTISPGTNQDDSKDSIQSIQAIEMDEIMRSKVSSMDNASIITNELAEFTYKMNNGNISKLITDEKFANSLTKTLTNLQTGSKGLSEIWKRQNIIFIERFFNKKKKRKRRDLKS
jgi:phospholipid/cholesterol/gamma-HCH transport system substrate-binding protein